MYSYLMAENRTDYPTITICGADGIIFPDLPRFMPTSLKRVSCGSIRLEIYDNFMKQITVLWLPLEPYSRAKLIIYPDSLQFSMLP